VEMCGYCGKECTSACEPLQCDLCSFWVHAACEGLEKEQYKSLKELSSSLNNVLYYCQLNNCVTRSRQLIFNNVQAVLQSSKVDNDGRLQSLAKEQDSIHNTLSQLSLSCAP